MRQHLVKFVFVSAAFSAIGCTDGFQSSSELNQLSSSFPRPTSPVTGQLVPSDLMPLIGPLVSKSVNAPSEVLLADSRYVTTEINTYTNAFLPTLPGTPAVIDNHYGALRSRLQWAIRNGLPWGNSATATTEYYGRGRQILMQYMNVYSTPNGHALPPHNNTAMKDVEILWRLEGDQNAYNHICRTAQDGTYKDGFGYYDMTAADGDPRQVSIRLQGMNAAYRMGIPFASCAYAGNGGGFNNVGATSWVDAGNKLITAIMATGLLKSNGAVHSNAHGSSGQCGTATVCEAYFMNAMLATEFLRWHGFVSPNLAAFNAAALIVDHVINEYARHGLPSLPYLSTDTTEAPELAAYWVWPSLVLWQETGDPKYRAFALVGLAATQNAYLGGIKQFNQNYSTNSQTAEALLAGYSWK